jgi:hypothetical protein
LRLFGALKWQLMYIKLPIYLFSKWGLDLMILMGANPLLGPLEGVGPYIGFGRIKIIMKRILLVSTLQVIFAFEVQYVFL